MRFIVALFPCASLTANDMAYALRDKYIEKIIGITSNSPGEDVTAACFDEIIYKAPTIEHHVRDWMDFLRAIRVTHMLPTNDAAVSFMAGLQQHIPHIRFMTPKLPVCCVMNKKWTYRQWPDISPRLYPHPEVTQWYLKPAVGHSSIDCRHATEHDYPLADDARWVVCEYLPGPEYTVECMGSELLGVRQRSITRTGLSVLTERAGVTETIQHIFNTLCVFLNYDGPWFFQVKHDKLLEVQTRLPGAGVAYLLLYRRNVLLEWVRGVRGRTLHLPVTRILKTYMNEVTLRPDFNIHTVMVDWDDTLYIGEDQYQGRVNSTLLACLYDLRGHLRLVLSTRHRGDLLQSLHHCYVNPLLFDAIERPTGPKSSCEKTLLIDDSFRERSLCPLAVDTPTAIPILQALVKRPLRRTTCTPWAIKQLTSTYIQAEPTVLDHLQLSRIRQHIYVFETSVLKNIGATICMVLDIGPDQNPFQSTLPLQVHTLDLPGVPQSLNSGERRINKQLVGDLTDYVPSTECYDYVRCSEVLEHCTQPWKVPESLWKLVRPGGWVLVTVPYSFRLHGPNPDGTRWSPEGLRIMFEGWLQLHKLSILQTPGAPLAPTHICALFYKSPIPSHTITWALEKGVSGLRLPTQQRQFANYGRVVQQLETQWIHWMHLDPLEYEAVACCNGTVGLDALVRLHSTVEQWYVQRNSFWSDVENSLQNAIVLPMDAQRGGPDLQHLPTHGHVKHAGLVVTSVMGQMTRDTQLFYASCQQDAVVIFDHAAVVDPADYAVGHGAMFSLHETKPLGRGEGGILVVPQQYAQHLRGLLAFAPRKEATNGKMSEIAATFIMEWWHRWQSYVYPLFLKRVQELKQLVLQYGFTWIYDTQVQQGATPTSLAILVGEYDLPTLQTCTPLPLRRYYYPLDSQITTEYTHCLVCPIQPHIPLQMYEHILQSLMDQQNTHETHGIHETHEIPRDPRDSAGPYETHGIPRDFQNITLQTCHDD
jgi:SAM-dependent methyltransferase